MSVRRILVLMLILSVANSAAAQERSVVADARALRDAGELREAIQMLRAHLAGAPDDVEAELVLAEALYWGGDFTAAARHFRRILEWQPDNAAARNQLHEIRSASAPSLLLRGSRITDNQPVERTVLRTQGVIFLNPLWSLRLNAEPARATSGAVQLEHAQATATLSGYLPVPRLELELGGGAVASRVQFGGARASTMDALASVRLGVRAAPGFTISAGGERAQYSATIASLMAPFMTETGRVTARYDRAGWIGEAAASVQRFPDTNLMTTSYAWLLAPLVRARSTLVQAGLAASFQDARESRLQPDGSYVPYFTPEREIQAGAAASIVTWSTAGARLQVNGAHALYGRKGFSAAREAFAPYSVHAAFSLPVTRVATLSAEAEHLRTSFYKETRAAVSIVLIFAPRPAT